MKSTASAVESLKAAINFHPRDWALESRDAWIYGIVVGWGSELPEVAKQHHWSKESVTRLRRLHRELRYPKTGP